MVGRRRWRACSWPAQCASARSGAREIFLPVHRQSHRQWLCRQTSDGLGTFVRTPKPSFSPTIKFYADHSQRPSSHGRFASRPGRMGRNRDCVIHRAVMMGTGFVPFTLDLKTWAARSANAPLPVMTRAYPRSLGSCTSKLFISRYISPGAHTFAF